ncbi:hypothetical protein QR90_14825 [Deinococcus radiopugnans]|uniref:MYXO-CTERM domain-containing protein n=2 Tax=Deinococcus radiopugnans TaxID=57497 RepID=A0A0A7KJ05_9DEIO|nr:WGxxGxxG family protein [Deinococcus radiopugnans]AIZ46070.1 hypothetical protein QR90_14825 [Deinococcus radiopugnans]MBB6017603.1 MYXO-CTERM domain-containing protein [Deinococcus radiopugnans ATCC 19172]TNM70386.1 MYXO-CTERM sorting domain-containing protein [Deinococcus radiopugnans ATCC 19172]
MKRFVQSTLLFSLLLAAPIPAFAQTDVTTETTAPVTTNTTTTGTTTAPVDADNGFDWGWLGLLGLLGLAGLRRREDRAYSTTTPGTGPR